MSAADTACRAAFEEHRPTREQCVREAAQVYRDALAERDSMSPDDAARAAGARTEAEVAALAARIRELRAGPLPQTA